MSRKSIISPPERKRVIDVINACAALSDRSFHQALNVDDGAPNGRFEAFNDAIGDTHFSEPLTNYAVGWRDPNNLDQLLSELAPEVQVGRRFEFREFINADEFLIDTDDERNPGASFKEVRYTSKLSTGRTVNRGLQVTLDWDEIDEMPNAEAVWTGRIMRRLIRSELYRALALLDAASTNAAKVWSAATNPDADLRAAVRAAADVHGQYPTTVLFGETAWGLRLDAYEAQNTPAAGVKAGYTPQALASHLMVDRVLMNKARYASTATARTEMVGSKVYLYLAELGLGPEDPSNIKRFTSAVQGGGTRRVYRQELDGKRVRLSVEHYSTTKITSTLGILKRTITAS